MIHIIIIIYTVPDYWNYLLLKLLMFLLSTIVRVEWFIPINGDN